MRDRRQRLRLQRMADRIARHFDQAADLPGRCLLARLRPHELPGQTARAQVEN